MSRRILQIVSWLALIGTILPSVLFVAERITLDQSKKWLLVATCVWFATTPFWMGRQDTAPDETVIP